MSKVLERPDGVSEWGIEPIPRQHRQLSGFDLAVLWGDLGIGLLVLVTGALLVPALGFYTAMIAIVVGSIVGVALLALGAVAGAEHGVPTMVLFRPVLGIRGSWFPSAMNILQLIGWTAVELWAMSFVADLVARQVFGISARWLWLVVASVVCTGLALWGPVGVTRVWLKRFGAWAVIAICVVVTVLVLTRDGLAEALRSTGAGGFPSFGLAVDLVIAMPISWLPLVADYSRFARRPGAAGWGTFAGYLVANVWLYALGALLVLQTGSSPDPAGVAGGLLAVTGGSIAGVLFLFGLLVGETDEAFADLYSGAVSLQNIWPGASRRGLTLAIAAIATGLAAWLTMARYESFLFLIGSVFIPLFGILCADHFFNRRGRIDLDALFSTEGRYWFTSGIRLAAFLPWLAGFAVYHWIAPVGPLWWTELIATTFGSPLSASVPWLGASVPSFFIAFTLSLIVPRLSSWRSDHERGGDENSGQVRDL